MIFASLVALAVVALCIVAWISKSGQAPGIADGRLTRCPDSPNCVCSEYRDDEAHFVAPIELQEKSAATLLARVRAAIVEQGGTIRSAREDYLAATYSSPFFGFVDDLEVRVDAVRGLVQVRSASRVGYGDFGVNRKRVERLRELLLEDRSGNG